jgi:hypothetical protein
MEAKYNDVGLRSFVLADGTPNGPIEFLLATGATQDQSATYVAARVPVECSEIVNLVALRLAALREVRTIIGTEIQRLERLRSESNE